MKGKIAIDESLCKGCGYCAASCPKGLISLGDRSNENGYFLALAERIEGCTGCALCAEVCPEIAIEVWRAGGDDKAEAL